MKYKILKTGSSGNAVLLENGLLLDCGVPFKLIEPHLKKIKAVFVSHEHKDHMNISTLKRIHELRPTVRFLAGFWLKRYLDMSGIKKSNIDYLIPNKTYDYNLFKIIPFILIHDVKNIGIKILDKKNKEKVLYAVDTKKIDHIRAVNYDLYLIEANYDEEKLEQNIKRDKENGLFSYGERVKETHLSIQQVSGWLLDNAGENSVYEFLHRSKNNF